jgi:macrolide-specific efflux system membrane fusion protein
VKKGSIVNRITCTGYFTPEKQVDVSFKSRDGYLKTLNVTPGQQVTKGFVLATLDTDTLESEIKRQELVLQRAKDVFDKLKKIADIDISISRMALDALKRDLELKYRLRESMAQVEIEKQERAVTVGEYEYNKVVMDYEYQLADAENDIQMARLRLDELKEELEKSIMRAPIKRIVDYVALAHEGEYLEPYETIVRIAQPVRLVLKYTGTQHDHFRLGMTVDVVIDSKKYGGKVIMTPFQVPVDDYEKMKETVLIRVDHMPPDIRIDDDATIEAVLEQADDVIVIPRKFVHSYLNREFVKIFKNNMVSERDVETGIETTSEYEIKTVLIPVNWLLNKGGGVGICYSSF